MAQKRKFPSIRIIAEGVGGDTRIFFNDEEITGSVQDYKVEHDDFPGLFKVTLTVLATGEVAGEHQKINVAP